ncbi:DNA pilot protein [Apis mellifera associated microvirus 45]|nr:DNA pilot protein [Apis mellifera associated microvirus 45]
MSYVNAYQDREFQRAAMQDGIKWKVADAKAAGIHPLYALNAPPFSPSPTSISFDGGGSGRDLSGFANMGQGLERVIEAVSTKKERAETAEEAARKALSLEHGKLQNDLLRAQIASITQRTTASQIGPPFPSVNGPKSPTTAATNQSEIKPNEITSSQGSIPHAAAGPVAPSNQWRIGPNGRIYPTPEKNLQMDDFGSPGWLPWMYNNHVLPFAKQFIGRNVQEYAPPKSYLPEGATHWHKLPDGSWEPRYRSYTNRGHYNSRYDAMGNYTGEY